jgi:deoxyribose-phosphate aldolase
MFSFSLLSGINFNNTPEEVRTLLSQEFLVTDRKAALTQIFSCLDYTSLDGTDNPEKIGALCHKALAFAQQGLPYPAAVCVYPPFISLAKQILKNSPVKVATTAAAFPHGQMPIGIKLEEVKYAVAEGADEIDVVISRGTLLDKNYHVVFRELDLIRDAARGKTLKVILETGELLTPENIARASEIAIEAGADFIKTSTGKVNPAATEEAVYVMLQVIGAYHRKTGKKIGIKPAGGIAEPLKALTYYQLVNTVLGPEWLTSSLFRIGASRLADNIIEHISLNSQ